jgi:hypothetical protein
MFESYTRAEQNHYEKRLRRENTIRLAMEIAQRVSHGPNGGTYQDIKQHSPQATPRKRAMVRSVIVNGGIVDSPHYD